MFPLFLLSLAATIEYGTTELCDEHGWCVPIAALSPGSAAANDDALAVADPMGAVAVWADGAWRGVFAVPKETELRALRRDGEAILLTLCHGAHCEVRRWDKGAASAGLPTPAPAKPRRDRWAKGQLGGGARWRTGTRGLELERDGQWLVPENGATGLGVQVLQKGPHPIFLLVRHTTSRIVRLSDSGLQVLHAPWSTEWIDDRIEAFGESAGCSPCLLGLQLLWNGPGGWKAVPAPSELDWTRRGLQSRVRVQVEPQVAFELDGKVQLWDGEKWSPGATEGPWAAPVKRAGSSLALDTNLRRGASHRDFVFGTAERAVALLGINRVALRPWSTFPLDAPPSGQLARVVGVAPDDSLTLRRAPLPEAPPLGALGPQSSCLALLELSSRISGSKWQLLRTAGGAPGWVNASYLKRLEAPAAANCRAASP